MFLPAVADINPAAPAQLSSAPPSAPQYCRRVRVSACESLPPHGIRHFRDVRSSFRRDVAVVRVKLLSSRTAGRESRHVHLEYYIRMSSSSRLMYVRRGVDPW